MHQTKTITNVKNLKINKLTEDQYKEAKAAGLINEDELYLTPATEIVLIHDGNGNVTLEGAVVLIDGNEVAY